MTNRSLLCVILALLCASVAFSQSKTMGTLSGTVTDPSDSSVPQAKVAVTNTETGAGYARS